ncbi:MAG: class I SAM-dependent methyltransferase [Burkholderiaceae bacterium]|nr:class I SAM-dependent methyltransferase [Microbacteriaceae bacterium]
MWDTRYAAAATSASSVWSLDPNEFVAATLADTTPGTAIDLGCGEGRNALWLAQRGWQVTAVDFSGPGLASGHRRATELGVQIDFVHADATVWRSPRQVDLVLLAYLQLDAAGLAAAIDLSAAALAPGGRLVLVAHDVDNVSHGVGGPQDRSILTTVDALHAAVAAVPEVGASGGGLEIERCEQYLRPIGDGHAVDVVLIARRI